MSHVLLSFGEAFSLELVWASGVVCSPCNLFSGMTVLQSCGLGTDSGTSQTRVPGKKGVRGYTLNPPPAYCGGATGVLQLAR